ncbi:MAG: hypothetical protein IKJ26_01935 [Clostridia bacterium]|nr:hypothetical protein [Clostridia bacterium]
MRKALLTVFLAALALCLCGCSTMPSEPVRPDVRMLDRPLYADEQAVSAESSATQSALRLDLWLDASHTMGGINLNEESMYPHYSRKYREGGFHYRYEDTTGLYENVLRTMLAAAEGSRVRLLRCGDERLTDAFLAEAFSESTDLRSLRRDMLTYAIDPMPTVFAGFSAERMDGSFYSLGSPQLNQLPQLDAALLENPAYAQQITDVLSQQIRRIQSGDMSLTAIGQDADYPLLYALDNLDPSRLSVITCDPASIRKTTAVAADGTPHDLIADLLEERGVFDNGLSVGMYAFTLDYIGQLSSFSTVDFSEPLVWGHLKYNTKKGRAEGVLPMPRTLLTLVIGQPQQVADFTKALNETFDTSAVFKALRGPEKGELTYARSGQTITQQPFTFDYVYTQIDRPTLAVHTHHTQSVILSAETVDAASRLITLPAGEGRTFTVTLPLEDARAELTDVELKALDALTLSHTLPNLPDVVVPENAQVIPLRDTLYVYEQHVPENTPFTIVSVERVEDTLVFTIQTQESLEPGYYHLSLSADYAGHINWQTAPWVEELSCSFTNEQIAEWEAFSRLMTQFERRRENVSRPFQHAWGPATDALYHGTPYPDFPPVDKVPQLSSLVSQVQTAANVQQTPCVRYTFDVFAVTP